MEISIVTPAGQSGSFTIGSREQGLSLEDLPERHLKLLDEPVTAGMACVNGNGTIHTSPVWVSRDHAEILLNSVRGRQKDRNLRLRRHVSLLFMDPADPFHWMAIQGEVVTVIDEDDPIHGHKATKSIDAMSQSYLGESTYPLRDPAGGEVRSLYRVRPNRAQVFGHA
jgi:PPOX class probable F420-dependent enzyme